MNDAAAPPTPGAVRALTQARLDELGVRLVGDVALLEEDQAARSAEAALGRLFALHACAAASFGFDRAAALAWLTDEGFLDHATDPERAWLEGRGGDAYRFQVGIEAMWALAWCLGLEEELDPTEPCVDEFVMRMPDLREAQGTRALAKAGRMRGLEALRDQLDLHRCLHHAAMACELGGPALPDELPMHRTAQRHRALAWVLGDEPWELAGTIR